MLALAESEGKVRSTSGPAAHEGQSDCLSTWRYGFRFASGDAPESDMVSALSGQPVGLCGHDEVVPMEAADLVSPPGHRDPPPLGEKGGMVTLRLGEGADPV